MDSAAEGSSYSRYSVIACGPRLVLSAWEAPLSAAGVAELELQEWRAERFGPPSEVRRFEGRPFDVLEQLLAAWQLPSELRASLPWPFIGGAIGIAGYDAGRFIERLPSRAQADVALPAFCWLFCDAVFVHEHASGRTQLVVTGRGESETAARSACAQLMAAFGVRFRESAEPPAAPTVGPVQAYADADTYARTVRDAVEHIAAGDVFEVCTSHRLEVAYTGSGWPLYTALRAVSPAAFACYVVTPWASLLSSSPERFLSLDAQRWAETRPIKGTRPRGVTADDDERLRRELRDSEKDRAENVMIVDLARNDLGRVCEVGTVHVPEALIIEQHPRVFHLVSTVRGRLARSATPVQLFVACFPPGSMTGAPKIEAMKIIDALEPYRRGFYAGAVGYVDVGGRMDFSVVIRSFVLTAGRCYFSVGGAVVADSDAHGEFLESMDKARGLLEALAQTADFAARDS